VWGRLRGGKTFFHVCSIGRCARVFGRQAHALWPEIYADLTRERAGIVASLTGRAAPHTIRLAVIYALLDGSPCIDVEHLKAAVAVWDYAEQSARYVFDGTTGDKVLTLSCDCCVLTARAD
jgi:hypothetical protein